MMNWLNQDHLVLATIVVAVVNVCRVFVDTKKANIQKESAEQIEKAILSVRQSIRRSAALICLAITLLVLAILMRG